MMLHWRFIELLYPQTARRDLGSYLTVVKFGTLENALGRWYLNGIGT
jgi:hypothetical protein